MNDILFALRGLRRAPGFALTAILALALGIGATTAVFSVVDGVVLRPLDYRDAERVVGLWSAHPELGPNNQPSYPDFLDWRAQTPSLAGAAFVRGDGFLLRGADGAERVLGAKVSEGFFDVIGGRAVVGRTFVSDEERPGGAPVVVLGHGLWTRRFGADPKIVGQTLTLGDRAYTVVGVLSRGANYPEWAEFYTPLGPTAAADPELRERALRVDNRAIGRLAPGATIERANAELATVARRLAAQYPETNARWGVSARPLQDDVVGGTRRQLFVLLGAVGFVLLIACANLANLVLARAAGRARELAVRTALGASRARLVRQLLTEGLVLAAVGGALGAALATLAVRAFVRATAAQPWNVRVLPRLEEVGVDGRVLAAATVVTVLTALLFSLAPALHASRLDLVSGLREGGRGAAGGRGAGRLRAVLVSAEVALALALLAGAGLLVESARRVAAVDLGYDAERVLTIRMFLPEKERYATPERIAAFYEGVRESAAALPGVGAAAIVNHAPFGGLVMTRIEVPGRTPAASDETLEAVFKSASPEFFATIGMRVVRGRGFARSDMTPMSDAVVVSESMAGRYWPGQDAVGREIVVYKAVSGRPDFRQPVRGRVVGVVNDSRPWSVEGDPPDQVFIPYTVNVPSSGTLVVRASGDPAPLVRQIRRTVSAADRDIPVADVQILAARVALATATRRLHAGLLGSFSLLALVLAVVGVYGVLAYAVSQRTREMGVRLALGARPAAVVRLVVRQGMAPVGLGLAAGVAGALALSRVLEGLVYDVSARDPRIVGGAAAALAVVALAATLLPARRAARVDPAVALRAE